MSDNFDGFMRRQISAGFFRAMVGRQIFCPKCQRVLDYRSSVLFGTAIVCRQCYDVVRDRVIGEKGLEHVENLERSLAEKLDFIDGRQFDTRKRKGAKREA